MRRQILAVLVLGLMPLAAWAEAPRDSWGNLKQLQPGHKIKVVDMKFKSWSGKLVSVSEETIILRDNQTQHEINIERTNVLRVADLQQSRRGRNALIGFGSGIAVGAVWATQQEEDVGTALPVLLVGGVFGGIGAGVGAFVPAYRTIYRQQRGPAGKTVGSSRLGPHQ